ncbi:MAG TPA: DUF1800 domain-containing protein [Pyrinomonadaceae bacterium]|nr:DUF1800 domain-containing protein [Pyrinomonadaceae bacterium]
MIKKISFLQKITAFLMVWAVFSPMLLTAKNINQINGKKSLTETQKIIHVLNRLGFGVRSGDVEKVKSIGIDKYIEQQLNPSTINDSTADAKVKNLPVLAMSNEELFAKYPNPGAVMTAVAQKNGLQRDDLMGIRPNQQNQNTDEMKENQMSEADRQKYQKEIAEMYRKYNLGRPNQITQQLISSRIIRATYSERQLQEVMVDFWSNHFNVYSNKAATRWFLPEYDRDVIRPNALGNFKDLLLATAKSPAMLFYLDNFQSISPNANNNNQANNNRRRNRLMQNQQNQQQQRQQRGINENYAREIMELHTLGVDGGYTQEDIRQVARAFTGWTIVDARGYRRAFAAMANGKTDQRTERQMRQAGIPTDTPSGTFYFNERWHDDDTKTVLGQKINEGGIKDGLKVIEILVNHPSTAKFIARKLAVKFVSDAPSEKLVNRVAEAFTKSKGDIKTTLRALFTSEEFFAAENYRAKIKTPFELLVSSIRTLGADTNGGQVQSLLNKMGEQLYGYQAPTGYPDTAEDWVNTGALLERMNFAVALSSNQIPGTRVDLKKFEAKEKTQILENSLAAILYGEVNPNTRTMLLKQIEQPLIQTKLDSDMDEDDGEMMQGGGQTRQNRTRLNAPSGNAEVFKIVGLILGSPDFQRQ